MSSLYPEVDQSIPQSESQLTEIAENLFPETDPQTPNNSPSEETLIRIPNTKIHLIDQTRSVPLADGDFCVVRLRQGETIVAVLCRIGDQIQWPLAKDEAAVKLDTKHYFFSLQVPSDETGPESVLNYGLTIEEGQKGLSPNDSEVLDKILEEYSLFSVGKVTGDDVAEGEYWTSVGRDVEEYSSGLARAIASGSVHVANGILWCGDAGVERLKWGSEFMRRKLGDGSGNKAAISPEALSRMKRVKKMTKMCEDVATGILSGVVKVSGFFTGCIVNSFVGKKFFSLLPGEIVLASLDGFNKVFDAVEVAGRNVMSTTSVVTTGLVSQRYGDEAGNVTNVGFDAAGHALGAAWAVFKIRKAINPKSVIKPTTLAKAIAKANSADLKAKYNQQ